MKKEYKKPDMHCILSWGRHGLIVSQHECENSDAVKNQEKAA